jgi:triacylglycerol esterase/lipase EstA (alpha/beta hydrolase family)
MFRRFAAVCAAAAAALATALPAPASATPATAATPKAATQTAATQTAADPVVIVAGTFATAGFYETMAGRMRADGFNVSIYQLPNGGTGDIAATARDLAAFVGRVRTDTGAPKVDLVAHSQGGLVARQFIKFDGGGSEVDSLVSLGVPQYGTAIANVGAFFLGGNCAGVVACQQVVVGSAFLNALNADDDTPGPVRYTDIYTAYDELVRPIENATLRDGADNVLVQAQCPARTVGHVALATDGTVYDGVRDALLGQPVRLDCFAI